jgi:hypothetical protein
MGALISTAFPKGSYYLMVENEFVTIKNHPPKIGERFPHVA